MIISCVMWLRWTMRALMNISIHITVWAGNWIMAHLSFTVICTTNEIWAADWATPLQSVSALYHFLDWAMLNFHHLPSQKHAHTRSHTHTYTQYNLDTICMQTIYPLFITMLNLQGLWHLMWKVVWVQASKLRLLSLHRRIIMRSLLDRVQSRSVPARALVSVEPSWLAWFNTLQSGPVIELAA